MKLLKVPNDLLAPPYNNKALLLDGFSVVDSCFYTEKVEGRMFLEEHVLLYVVSGQIELYYGAKTVRVQANEMVVLRRATSYRFVKTGINRDGAPSCSPLRLTSLLCEMTRNSFSPFDNL